MSSLPRSIRGRGNAPEHAHSSFSASYLNASPVAQRSLERDLAESSSDDEPGLDDDDDSSEDDSSDSGTLRAGAPRSHSLASSYRRPSVNAFGGNTRAGFAPQPDPVPLTRKEKKQYRNEERSLLRDNHLAPPKHPVPTQRSPLNRLYRYLFSTKQRIPADEEGGVQETVEVEASETSALLSNSGDARERHESLNRQWEEAVAAGKIKTTWQRESMTILRYSGPLTITFILQYSLPVASIFTVGHIGKVELGACSLASMTANITGFAIYQGLATSLDTLCAQAYGSGRKHLVGLQLQRMVFFLWCLTIPIAIFWYNAEFILRKIIPEPRSAELAGLYLRVLICGLPGYVCFEAGKRFVQAQGLFSATTYVLLIAAPINIFMNWLFVWKFEWGFIGAPIAVVVTDNMLPLLLLGYVCLIDGKQCWNGFTKRALHNWGPMIKLALPGLVMVEAEFLAFEILTLVSSYFGTTHLAAQSILITITSLTFQIPFSLSIATSTRVANLIGATLSGAAKTTAKVTFFIAAIIGVFDIILLSSLRHKIPQLFTNDKDVIDLVVQIMPMMAAFQLVDALAANCNGLLRGLGRQEIGGYVNLFCYYVVAMPVSLGTAFGLGWELQGLWLGVAIALGLVAMIEGWFLSRTDWKKAVENARVRNNAG